MVKLANPYLMFSFADRYRTESCKLFYLQKKQLFKYEHHGQRAIFFFILVSFSGTTVIVQSASLSDYLVSSFTSPDPDLPFNHIARNNVTGDVYIGARERLYQLDSDLSLREATDTGPCPTDDTQNDNQLLLVAPSPVDKLITCGSCDGFCETRHTRNISMDVITHDDVDDARIASSHDDYPVVGDVALGSAFSSPGSGSIDAGLYLFTGASVSGSSAGQNPFKKHRFSDLRHEQQSHDYSIGNLLSQTLVEVVAWDDFLYYVMNREQTAGKSVHVGRLCRNTIDQDLSSYSEIELTCGAYDIAKASHIGPAGYSLANSLNIGTSDGALFAVVTKSDSPESESALCIYTMADIQERFLEGIDGCIQGNSSTGTTIDTLTNSECRGVSFHPTILLII